MASGDGPAAWRAELEQLELLELEAAFKAKAQEDLIFFCRNVLGYRDLDDDLHGSVAQLVLDTTKPKKLLLLPRGHLKSSLVTVGFTLWLIVNDPDRTVTIISETSDLACDLLFEIKEHLEQNELLRYHWSGLVPEKPKVWKTDRIIVNRRRISKTPTVRAMGMGEATAGRHPDVMIFDDPISNRTVTTEDMIRKSKQSFQELQALLEPQNDRDPFVGTEIVIGTRWHWQDLYSFIIDKLSPDIFSVMVRAAIENGRVIFPQKFSRKLLEEIRETVQQWTFSSQYLNNPVDSENATFPQELISSRMWDQNREQFLEQMNTLNYLTVDPSWGEGEDYSGILVGARTESNRLYVLEATRVRTSPDRLLETIIATAMRWRVRSIGFESDPAGQNWLMRNLQDLMAQHGIRIPVVAMSHGNKAKAVRILGLVPELQYKRLWLHKSCDQLVTEFVQWPRGGHDDLLDSCAMLVDLAAPPGRRRHLTPDETPGTGEYEIAKLEERGRRADRFASRRQKVHGRRGRW